MVRPRFQGRPQALQGVADIITLSHAGRLPLPVRQLNVNDASAATWTMGFFSHSGAPRRHGGRTPHGMVGASQTPRAAALSPQFKCPGKAGQPRRVTVDKRAPAFFARR